MYDKLDFLSTKKLLEALGRKKGLSWIDYPFISYKIAFMVKIGNVTLSKPMILAPMAGISSYPYRAINREMGVELAYLEMISARALSYLSRGTKERMLNSPNEGLLGIQLLAKDPYYILKALDRLKDYKFDILDFNAACPQKKITNNGKGAYLLKEPKKLNSLLKCLIKNTDKPVTLKMRLGWDSPKDALRIAKGAADCGVSAICIHGRTREQGYRDGVDYKAISRVKKALKIPIIGSGDILSAELAKKMFEQAGADAVTVARGALGNPWIFREISELLKTGQIIPRPKNSEITRMMKQHLNLTIKFFGEKTGVMRFRKFYIWYTRGISQAKPLRTQIAGVKTKIQMLKLIKSLTKIAP